MTYRHAGLALVLCTVAAGWLLQSSASTFADPPRYTVTDLSVFGLSDARDINNPGSGGRALVASQVVVPPGEQPALFRFFGPGNSPAGQVIPLNTFGGTYGNTIRVNDAGQAIGYADTPHGARHAFFFDDQGHMTDVSGLTGSQTELLGLNNTGTAVGFVSTGGVNHALIYAGGATTDLGAFGAPAGASLEDINDNGTAIGWAYPNNVSARSFIYASGSETPLPTFGGTHTFAYRINSFGQVAGTSEDANGIGRAFLYSGGSMMLNLGNLLGPGPSSATALNDGGEVVGSAGVPDGSTAFLFSQGVMYDLNSLITDHRYNLVNAYAINDAGQIVAQANVSGQLRPVLLTRLPIPLPPALWTGAGLLAALALIGMRRSLRGLGGPAGSSSSGIRRASGGC